MLFSKSKRLALIAGALLATFTAPIFAQDSGPLIDLLVRKGIVTDQEAEDIRAELIKDFAINAPAGKLDIPPRVSRFALAGDVRIRYQYDNEVSNNFANTPGSGFNNDRSRYRYRFRFGPTVTFSNNWIAGFRLETAAGSTSTNDDFGAAGSTNFAKDGNTAFVGQAWIEYAATNWRGIDRVNFKVGKHLHPFFTPGVNGFWIDTDINPEGLSEELVWNDVGRPGWSLALRAGQYVLANNSRTTDRVGGFLNDPSILWMGQVEFSKTHIYENNPYGFRFAPAFAVFTAPEVTGTTLNQADSATTSNYDNLATIILPFEYVIALNNRPLGFYGTYGFNLKGGTRANWLYSSSGTVQNLNTAAGNPSSYNQMFNAGIRYGATRNPGDWQAIAEWRYIEPGAYTSVLLDSDFNGGRVNGSGFIASFIYAWTDAISSTVTFFHANNVDRDSSANVGFHRADVLQVDLSARF
jgi:hypothetical protein